MAAVACACMVPTLFGNPAKEFLTDKEIELIQENHEISIRVKLYLDFAASRLKAAEQRLSGKESEAGDPFEFLAPEDMLDGYYRILESVMRNLDDAAQRADPQEESSILKALRSLKVSMESAFPELEILKKIAEEKDKEHLWNQVNKAIDISKGAHEGAVLGLARQPNPTARKPPSK